ncbi:hypothetical protein TWF281_008525 [Arthrobotrys megalospora]
MSLETGRYYIQGISQHNPVGRHHVEDRSLLPKRVLSLPPDMGGQSSAWIVEKTGNETYRMKARDTYTGVIDHKLYAFLLPDPQPTDWVIKAHPEHGQNVYSIETMSGEGWTSTAEDENAESLSQIEIRPVQDSPNQLFELVRLSDY